MSGPANPSYPLRCLPPQPPRGRVPRPGEEVRVHGRLIRAGTGGGLLLGPEGERRWCRWPSAGRHPAEGDIVEVEGVMEGEWIGAAQVVVLAPAASAPAAGWEAWAARQEALRRSLELRARVQAALRAFFADAGFLEVETPALVGAPGQEAHLLLFETTYRGRPPRDCFLVSSPEHHMKRLLGAGLARIFQMGRAYRNGERSPAHHPEFSMLEWYRAYAGYEEIMADAEALVAAAGRAVHGATLLQYQGQPLDLTPPWPRLSVGEAFARFAGMDLEPRLGVEEFRRQGRRCCPSVDTADTWEEIFFKVLLERIEPGLAGMGKPVFLLNYPASLAALAKVRGPGGVAERVEVYAGGLELANGFTELNDPAEQTRRFAAERAKRAALGYPVHPLDKEFLEMLRLGMPPAGGMALGVDRLVMLLADAPRIDEVLAFPFSQLEGFA